MGDNKHYFDFVLRYKIKVMLLGKEKLFFGGQEHKMDEEMLEFALSTETDFAHLQKFLDAGYQGLYRLTEDQIRTRKGLPYNAFILDWMNSQELEINLRRTDQTHQRIRDEHVRGWENLNRIHFEVGRALRHAIQESGGTLPEDQPTPEKSIQQLQDSL